MRSVLKFHWAETKIFATPLQTFSQSSNPRNKDFSDENFQTQICHKMGRIQTKRWRATHLSSGERLKKYMQESQDCDERKQEQGQQIQEQLDKLQEQADRLIKIENEIARKIDELLDLTGALVQKSADKDSNSSENERNDEDTDSDDTEDSQRQKRKKIDK